MTRLVSIPVIALFCAVGAALAQDGTFRTWFETPDTVLAGGTFEVEMWASFEGDLLRPEGWFLGVLASFQVSGSLESFSHLTSLTSSLPIILSAGVPHGPWLRNVGTLQDASLGVEVDRSNPIRILSFDVTTGDAPGDLIVSIEPDDLNSIPVLGWTVDGDREYIYTTDAGIALFSTSDTIHVIPAPGAIGLLALAALGARRRRP